MRISPLQDLRFARLMEQAQEGNKESYEALLKELSEIMKGFLVNRIHDTMDAEDVLQEILISMHSARHTYDSKRPFAPWVFSIAYHRLADYQRRSVRLTRRAAPQDFDWTALSSNQDDPGEAQEPVVMHAASQLPDSQRRIVELLKLKGYSIKEAAREMGMSEGAVKVAAHRAYKVLRQRLEGRNE